MAEIFISYSKADHSLIETLVSHLKAAGHSVWWDSDLLGGARFSDTIEREVEKARIVLVVWSPSSIGSRWVADEADLGLQSGKMVPISLEGVLPPIGFRQIQSIDFSSWRGRSKEAPMDALLAALKHQSLDQDPQPEERMSPAPKPLSEAPEASIAVLPFVNMSPDPDQEYFADGISEELLNLLAKLKEMTVISRTSSFNFKGSNLPISEIGQQLRVAHILEGSVRKAGNRVRITAQLIETIGSAHVWSETYDRDLDDIFAIQDEISAAIVKELKSHLLPGLEAPTAKPQQNIGAYQDYLLGKQLIARRTMETIERAREAFERAVAADPIYVEALVGLADSILLLSDKPGCYGTRPFAEALADSQPHLKLAERLAPDWDEVWSIKALASRLANDASTSLAEAERAIALNPNNSRAIVTLGAVIGALGDPTRSRLSLTQKAFDLDPLSLNAISTHIESLSFHMRFDEARELIVRGETLGPNTQIGVTGEIAIDQSMGNHADILKRLHEKTARFPDSRIRGLALATSVYLGETYSFSESNPVLTFDQLLDCNRMDEAATYWQQLEEHPEELEKYSYDGERMRAIWHARNGNWEETENIIALLDDTPDKEWSYGYNLQGFCQSAVYLLQARLKLGHDEDAERVRSKLSRILRAHENRNEASEHFALPFLRAALSALDGQKEDALGSLEEYFSRGMGKSLNVIHTPAFEILADEPRFQVLRNRVEEHVLSERQKAIERGHLPLRQDILDLVLGKNQG